MAEMVMWVGDRVTTCPGIARDSSAFCRSVPAHSFQDNTVSRNETDTATPQANLMTPKKGYHITALLTDSTCPGRECLEEHNPRPLLVIGEIINPASCVNHSRVV